MNITLLSTAVNSLRFSFSKKAFSTVLLLFFFFGFTTITYAQCIGPYARFESAGAGIPSGFTATGTGASNATFVSFGGSTRSGSNQFVHIGTNADAVLTFPAIANPKVVSFYVRKSGATSLYSMEFSTDGGANWNTVLAGTNTINGVSITGVVPTLPTGTGLSNWDLVSATFNDNVASCLIRLKDTRPSLLPLTTGNLWIDDISWIRNKVDGTASTGFPENTIIVPVRVGVGVPTNCTGGSVTLNTNDVYNFYDNGGASDVYNISQTNQVTFTPSSTGFTAGDRIRIQFISYTGAANDKIEVWDNNGTLLDVTTNLLSHTTTALPTITTYISTISSDGSITIKFTSDPLATFAAGFNIKVDCVRCPIPSGLAASAVAATTATLDWNATTAGAYDIYYNTTGVLPNGYVTPTNINLATNTLGLTGLTTGVTYYVWVRSRCGSGPDSYSPWSPSVNFITASCSAFVVATNPSTVTQTLCQTVPASPLTVAASGATVSTYQWYSNTTATASGGIAVGANSATYTPLTTAVGTLYYYCVITSTTSCVVTTAVSGAVTVTGVVASAATSTAATTITTNGFTANWSADTYATGYFLDVSTVATFATFVPGYNNLSVGNVLTSVVTGLNPGTIYYYRVRAANTCGTSASSTTITVITTAITYCIPTGTAQDPNGITNVTLGTINNTTGLEANSYGNYTNLSTNVFIGSTLPFSITYRTGFTYNTFIWVDWNNDGDFTDPNERVYVGISTAAIPTTLSGTFAVPSINSNSLSTLGSHRLRIGGVDFDDPSDPCRNGAWQAYEDYTINVVAVPPCAISTPSALTAVNVTGTTASLVWSDAAMTPNTVYDYYVTTTNTAPALGSNPVGMGTVTGVLTANVTGLTLGVQYYFWVRTKCNSTTYSAWIGSATFTTANLDVINMTNGAISTCNGKFYDAGGFSSPYANNEDYTYTFTPASGNNLKVVFNSFATESNFDFLSIYDGSDTTAPLLGTFSGTQIAAGQAFYSTAANGGRLTFRFTSDGSATPAGWDATITCVNVPTITNLTPNFTCIGGTPLVTITGSNFTGATSVKFNGVAALYTFVNATTITATLPATATTGMITITTPDAVSSSSPVFDVRPIPAAPNAGADVTICSGQTTPLNAISLPTNNSLATTQVGGNGCNGGNMFNIITNSSPITINAFDVIPNNTGVQAVNVYYKVGTYVGSETNVGAWTLLGTYSINGVSKVLINMPTANLNIPASATYGIYVNFDASYTNGSNTYSNTDITINTGTGLCAAFGSVIASRTFNGKVYYQLNMPLTYSWIPTTGLSNPAIANPVANPTSTTTYTLTTSYNGCASSSDSVLITVNPKPTVSIPTASATLCGNSVLPVSVSGTATTTIWTSTVANTLFTNATASTPYVTGTNAATVYVKTPTTATITVTGSNASGCSDTASVTFTVIIKEFNNGFWTPGPPTNNTSENIVVNSGNYTIGGNISACSCTVLGGTVTVNTNRTLTLINGLTVAPAGAMTFNSGASLVQVNNVANSGNITYKRTTTDVIRGDYTYWSTPVAPQTLVGLSPLTPSNKYFAFNASANAWVNIASNNLMDVGKGYIIRAPGTFSSTVAAPFYGAFFGTPNNGTITTPIVGGANQKNLIGNPYPSALNADLFLSDPLNTSIIDATIYFWTHNTPMANNVYVANDYATYNFMGGVGTAALNLGVNTTAPTGKIASGQGFFIKGLSNGVATFTNAMRVVGSNGNFYRTTEEGVTPTELERHRFWLDITNTQGAYKQILVGYMQNATNGIDRGFDSEVFEAGNAITMYTVLADKKLSIQGRTLPFDTNDTVPLGYKSTLAGTFTIALTQFDGLFAEGQEVYLEDTLLNVIHDLKASAYTFATEVGAFDSRFMIRYTSGSALGVDTPVFNDSTVVVYRNEAGLFINAGQVSLSEVAIYDVRGRLLAQQKEVNATTVVFSTLPETQQVLLVKIKGSNGAIITKKVVY